jgi:ABC-type branched-subunit amino acid transport system ATPase component
MSAPVILRAEGWSVHRGPMTVVRELGFELTEGSALGILGVNGAGKTTIAEGLLGLLPSSGTLELAGQSLDRIATSGRARRGIALVPQGRRLIARMTVAENLAAARLAPAGRGPEVDIAEMFPAIAELMTRRAGLLSGGQQQQVAIARALLRRPELLVLDEPTEGLAPSIIAEIARALRLLRERGVTLILAEQHHHVIAAVCDQFIALRSGRSSEPLSASLDNLVSHAHQI